MELLEAKFILKMPVTKHANKIQMLLSKLEINLSDQALRTLYYEYSFHECCNDNTSYKDAL